MLGHIEKFRKKLASGEFCLGTGVTFSDPAVSEALSSSVDFLWIDLEHNPMSLESMQAHLMAARAGGSPALVRVPTAEVVWIKRVLDTGAEGIIFPQVRSAAEVQAAVDACRYPPLGTRGFGPRRPSNFGRNAGDEYLAEANRRVFTVAQIEAVEAVRDLDRILAVKSLDSVVIGPYDLSGSMGLLGKIEHPKVAEAVEAIIAKTRAAGLSVGMGMGLDEAYARRAAALGVNWVQCGSDFNYLVEGADRLFAAIRGQNSL
jgi:2-dehydro-3-deoxyglucarate aldolase/4-hydroxy-2-oxoheptanedioate aldolase